jgi:hypothetical protein
LHSDNDKKDTVPRRLPAVELSTESTFTKPAQLAKTPPPLAPTPAAAAAPAPTPAAEQPVVQASHAEPQPPAATPAEAKPVQDQSAPPAVVEKSEPVKPADPKSVYQSADAKPLPQPRFNSR